jgi:hypothetical protein
MLEISNLHQEVRDRLRKKKLVFGNLNHIRLAETMDLINKQIGLLEKKFTKKNKENLDNLLGTAKYLLDKDEKNEQV